MKKDVPRQLSGAIARVNRAEQLIRDFKKVVQGYEEAEYVRTRPRFDPAKGEYFIRMPRPDTIALPLEANAVVGDIINNLRAALDYLVFELAKHNEGKEVSNTQFVIEDDPKQFEGRKKSNLKGLSDHQVSIIEALQPYNGGDWMRVLVNISNPDKHRHLTAVNHSDKVEIVFGDTKNESEDAKNYPEARVFRDIDGRGANAYITGEMLGIYIMGCYPAIETLKILHHDVCQVIGLFWHEFEA